MRTIEEIRADMADAVGEDRPGLIERYYNELCGAIADGIPLDRLEIICAAERDGRCVVLPTEDRGSISDSYHTFDELYEQRAILFSALCRTYPNKAWKSKLHSDGSMFDGHFIVGIDTPDGQYTYHYGLGKWDWFPVKELDRAPRWDGHTANDARRMWSLTRIEAEAELKGEKK